MKKSSWLFAISGFVLGLTLLNTSDIKINSAVKAQSEPIPEFPSPEFPFVPLTSTPTIIIQYESPPSPLDTLDCPSDKPTCCSCISSHHSNDSLVTEESALQLDFYNEGATTYGFKPYALPHKIETAD